MGYNARNDEIRDNVTRMRREWEAQRGALATVRRFEEGLGWMRPGDTESQVRVVALREAWPCKK